MNNTNPTVNHSNHSKVVTGGGGGGTLLNRKNANI